MIIIAIYSILLITSFCLALYLIVDGILPWVQGKPVFRALRKKQKPKH